ncbi:hypothetical protein [Mycobacterium sp.]|uniref:hypothetical protein n=1 Tax=Mycobacterium sp. TaxID=1785 RepID=UPI003BB11187
MTGDTYDAALQHHINGFLTALGKRPDELILKRLANIEQPNPQDAEDFRRYVNDLKRAYGQGLLGMYQRIESHGRAICALTEETEITDPVRQIMKLVALDGEDVPNILTSFDEAAKQLDPVAILRLLMALQGASTGGVPRQARRDELILDFTAYCLTRFPPSDDN